MLHKTNSLGGTFKDVLGGLSIIIFLSSPSIAGYTTASAKNRANQILNSASVRAIVVSAQIQKGSETPTLGGFTDDAIGGATFENVVKNTAGTDDWNKATDKRFSLALTEVDEKVCTQIKASVGDNSIIRNIADDCTTITYNNDLSTTDLSPNNPAPSYDDNAGAKACSSDTDCDTSCQTCTDSKCISKCALGEYCIGGGKCSGVPTCNTNDDCVGCCVNGTCTTPSPYDEANCQSPGKWQQDIHTENYGCFDNNGHVVGTCSPEKIKSCTHNGQCDTGEYCHINANNMCSEISTGTCTSLGTVHTVSGKTGTAALYNGMIYTTDMVDGGMTWWSATNWCKAQGKRLVSLSDLGITRPDSFSCSGSECIGANRDALIEAFGNGDLDFWTNDHFGPCYAFCVNFYSESVYSDETNSYFYYYFPLCK